MKQITYIILAAFCFSPHIHAASELSQLQEKSLPDYLSTQYIGLAGRFNLHHIPIAASRRVLAKEKAVRSYIGFVSGFNRETLTAVAEQIEKSIQNPDHDTLMFDNDLLQQALKQVINRDIKRLAQIINDRTICIRLFNFTGTKSCDIIRSVSLGEQIENWFPHTKPPITLTQEAIASEARDVEVLCGQGVILPAPQMRILHDLSLYSQEYSSQEEFLKSLHEYAAALYNDTYSRQYQYENMVETSPNKYDEDFNAQDPSETGMTKIPVLVVNFEKYKEHVAHMLSKKNK